MIERLNFQGMSFTSSVISYAFQKVVGRKLAYRKLVFIRHLHLKMNQTDKTWNFSKYGAHVKNSISCRILRVYTPIPNSN
jgi:hypothetical protein